MENVDYYLWKDGKQQGPFTINQLKSMWAAGSITGADLYFVDGMSEWLRLSDMLDLLETKISTRQLVVKSQFYCVRCNARVDPKTVADELGNAFFHCPLCGDRVWSDRQREDGTELLQKIASGVIGAIIIMVLISYIIGAFK